MAIGEYYWSGPNPRRSSGPALKTRRPLAVGFIAGVLAALILSTTMSLARIFKISLLNLELNLGVVLMHMHLEPQAWWAGFVGFIFAGGALGMVYALVFVAGLKARFGAGLALGLLQWVLVGVALGLLPRPPSEVPAKVYQPGAFALQLGTESAVLFALVQVSFGVMVTNIFASSAAARSKKGELHLLRPEQVERPKKQAA